ncbi:MAG: DUF433 domain-containing protein [Candidatus Acidiferrales bacterium]
MTKEQLINRDKDILGGTPVFRGTRVPVQTLFDYLKDGSTLDQFLDGFPSVTREQAIGALRLSYELVLGKSNDNGEVARL